MQLPNGFKDYLLRTMKEEVVEELTEGLQGEPSISIRLNPRTGLHAGNKESELTIAKADGQVPWCPEGFYLRERPVFTADPLWHAGAYYVQEASSMFLAHVVRHLSFDIRPSSFDTHPSSFATHYSPLALDLCAAPGGKSTLLRSLLPDEWLLVSNEPVRSRCQVLAENMAKWGHPNVVVTNTYARDIESSRGKGQGARGFDLILADVPCSGEGMMRKEAEAVAQWSPQLVADCATLQRSIVEDIWPALRPGGILIYSTCTFNPDEDEENVAWIARKLGADVLNIPAPSEWGILGDLRKNADNPLPCYHFLPGRVRGEGFFCAVLQKHKDADIPDFIEENATQKERKKDKKKGKDNTKSAPLTMTDYLRQQLPTLPTDLLDCPEPDRKTGKVPPIAAHVELTLADAFRYLRGESLVLPPDTPHGIVQVCFQGHRLGLMKNLGARANNLYPKEWRIRSSYIKPETLNVELEP